MAPGQLAIVADLESTSGVGLHHVLSPGLASEEMMNRFQVSQFNLIYCSKLDTSVN